MSAGKHLKRLFHHDKYPKTGPLPENIQRGAKHAQSPSSRQGPPSCSVCAIYVESKPSRDAILKRQPVGAPT
jgi:hypothetical protein